MGSGAVGAQILTSFSMPVTHVCMYSYSVTGVGRAPVSHAATQCQTCGRGSGRRLCGVSAGTDIQEGVPSI